MNRVLLGKTTWPLDTACNSDVSRPNLAYLHKQVTDWLFAITCLS